MSNTAAGTHYIGQQNMLQHLFTILRIGSPRTRCLCLRILREVVPKLDPDLVVPSTKSWVSLSHLRSSSDPKALNALSAALLNVVGKCLLPVTETHRKLPSPKSFRHAHTLRYQKSNVGTAGGTGNQSSFANLVGYGSGESQCIFMSECIAFLRQMLHSIQGFEVGATVTAILENSSTTIETLTECAMSKEASDLEILQKDGPAMLQLRRIAAALSVCGAHLEYLRVGGNVRLPGGSVARLVAFDDDRENVWLTFGEAVQSLPQLVPLVGLRPVEEVNLQQGIIPMTSGMLALFMKLADLDLAGIESSYPVKDKTAVKHTEQNDAQYWLSTLKMLGMRSLAHLMLHEPTAQKVHAAGAMQNLLRNALREAELPAYVELAHLEYQSRTLRKRVLEVSPDRHGIVWTSLQPDQDAEGAARRARELMVAETRKSVATEMFENFGKAMNFTIAMISHALRINGDDKSAAYNWCGIHGPAWKRSHMGEEAGGASKSNSDEDPVWEKAMEVSSNYGFPPKLTWHALRMFGGVGTVSVQAAVEFMFGDGQQYIARLEKEEAKAEERDSFPQQREQLVIENLLMFGVDPSLARLAAKNSSDVESALDWISLHPGALEEEALRQSSVHADSGSMSSGSAAAADMSAIDMDAGAKAQEEADVSTADGLQDAAALEELGSARNLLLESSSYVLDTVRSSSAQEETVDDAGAHGESDRDIDISVASSSEQSRRQGAPEAWVTRLIPKRLDSASDAHVRGRPRETEMLPVVPGMLVVETEDAGEMGRLTHHVGTIVSGSNGRPIVTRQYSTSSSDQGDSRQLRVRYLNSQSGIAVQRRVSINKLRYIKRLFGEEIDSTGALRAAASRAAAGLAVQYGRHAMLSLLHHWPHDSAFNLDLFDNPQQLVDMVKMIAASEDGFASLGSDRSRPKRVRASSASTMVEDAMAILTAKLRKILKNESSAMDAKASSLASVLVRECTDHVFKTTKIGDSEDCKIFESLHPYWARGLSDGGYGGHRGVDYQETVEFTGAKALRIRFDSRCASETRSSLTFYGKDAKTVIARFNGPSDRWKSFVIHSERFMYRFEGRTDSHDPGWGYKFTVSPLLGLSWSRESQVLTEPSLEYACWILDFLLSNTRAQGGEGQVINVRVAVHDPKVFEALANYLRSPGAPYKPRVVYLITQLLKSPRLFPEQNMPDISKLDGVKRCVMNRCLQEQIRPGQMMLAEGLQQLVEMILVSREAKTFFAERVAKTAMNDADSHENSTTAAQKDNGISSVMSDENFLNRVLGKDCSSDVVSRLNSTLRDAESELKKIEKSQKDTAQAASRRKNRLSERNSIMAGGESKQPGEESDLLDLEAALVGTTGIIENLASETERLPTQLMARAFLLSDENNSSDFTKGETTRAAEKIVQDFAKFCASIHEWTQEEDRQLTCFLNDQLDASRQKHNESLRGSRRSTASLFEFKVSSLSLPKTRTAKIESRYGRLMDRPIKDIRARAAVIQSFNDQLAPVIPFLDLMAHESSDRIGARLKSIRHLVLMSVKTKLMDSALRSTQGNSGTSVTLDRYAAQQSKESRTISPDSSQSCFVQVFHQLYGRVAPRNLRKSDRVFDAGWRGGLGEGGVDAGGPYREALTTVCTDLFCEDQLDLFIRSPNGKDEVGETRDRFVPNPEYTSPQAIKMYEFCGMWMGISFRTKASLPFQLPSMLWKTLVGQTTDLSDVGEIDFDCVQRLKRIRTCGAKIGNDEHGSARKGGEETEPRSSSKKSTTILSEAAENEFSAVWEGLVFNTRRSDGSLVDLIPGGSGIEVFYQRRNEYANAVENFRVHEFDQQFAAIRRGFGTIVPLRLMPLFTWQEAEVLVCGTPEINVAALKMHTVYQGFSGADDPTVKAFWAIMEEWGNEERSRFIQFAWGRQRLPQPGAWTRNMKLSRLGGDANQMPVSHTCFFHIEMPAYTSIEQARKMLGLTLKFGLGSMMLA
jgi:hypothetical protein